MRIIGHLDMDAFFAAVEERDNPRWKSAPIVVGADPAGGKGRGVVSTANYKAREYGIHSAMPISFAWLRSEEAKKNGRPAAIFLPVEYARYAKTSERIFLILRRYVGTVEESSIDEAYFDLSQAGSFDHATALGRKIKKEIKDKEKLTASIGIGPNKLVAKIASDFKKPDGLTVVTQRGAEKFLESLAVRRIPGIGPKTEKLLEAKNIRLVKDLKKHSEKELEKMLGKLGRELFLKIRGLDDSPLVEQYETKSIGEQETFLIDTRDTLFLFEKLKALCKNIWLRFQKEKFRCCRTISITVRYSDFETKSHAHTFDEPAANLKTLEFESMKLLLPFLDKRLNPKGKAVRLLGVRIEKLN